MTLDEYKQICTEMVEHNPPEPSSLPKYFLLMRLSWLYELAADVPFEKSEPFFNHWWSLPVEQRFKEEILRNVRAK